MVCAGMGRGRGGVAGTSLPACLDILVQGPQPHTGLGEAGICNPASHPSSPVESFFFKIFIYLFLAVLSL